MRLGSKLNSLFDPRVRTLFGIGEQEHSWFIRLCMICSIPRWFTRDIARRLMLRHAEGADFEGLFDELESCAFVQRYGNAGFSMKDTLRYYFLSLWDGQDLEFEDVVCSLRAAFELSASASSRSTEEETRDRILRSDAYGVFLVEAAYLNFFVDDSVQTSLFTSFSLIYQWRREPYYNYALCRRLVKALSDHVRTGILEREAEFVVYRFLKYSLPPWRDNARRRVDYARDVLRFSIIGGKFEAFAHFNLAQSLLRSDIPMNIELAVAESRRALELYERMNDVYGVGECERHLGLCYSRIDQFEESDSYIGRAECHFLEWASDKGITMSNNVLECLRARAWNFYYSGDSAVALELAIKGSESARAANWNLTGALFDRLIAKIYLEMGNLEDAEDYLAACLVDLGAAPDGVDLGNALVARASLRMMGIKWNEVEEQEESRVAADICADLDWASTIFENIGSELGAANALYYEGQFLLYSGDIKVAAEKIECARRKFEAQRDKLGVGNALRRLFEIAILRGDLAMARSLLSEVRAIREEIPGRIDLFESFMMSRKRRPDLADDIERMMQDIGIVEG